MAGRVLALAAAAVHVLGELRLAGASFVVVFGLAREWAHGQYQAVCQTGRQVGNMIAPPLLTALVIGWGEHGWLGLAVVFIVAGLISSGIPWWAMTTRERAQPTVISRPAP